MADFLNLTADFFDRVINPAYGPAVNEEYELRLAALLADEQSRSLLTHEVALLSDPNTLTAHGWLWFLSYARSNSITLSPSLLLQLAERWSSVSMLVLVIDTATQDKQRAGEWLSELLRRVTVVEERPDARMPERDVTARAESVLVALMQAGNDSSLQAAANLLRREWRGQNNLVEFFWSLTDELDQGTRRVWIERLEPPHRRENADGGNE